MQINKPIVGDIVHFIGADNVHYPALVHIVRGPGVIDVYAFLAHSAGHERNVPYREPNSTRQEGETLIMEPAPPRTWHWIEDEPGEQAPVQATPEPAPQETDGKDN